MHVQTRVRHISPVRPTLSAEEAAAAATAVEATADTCCIVPKPLRGAATRVVVPARLREAVSAPGHERGVEQNSRAVGRWHTFFDAEQVAARRQGPRGVEPQRLRW